MPSRISGIEEKDAPIILKPLYIGFKRVAGKISTSLKVSAHRPSIAWFGNLFGIAIENPVKSSSEYIY